MEEIWKDIEGYEGLYQISNLGRIWTTKYKRFKNPTKCKGYLQIGLSKNKKRKMYKVHRLVAIAFVSNPNNKPYINHIDGNKSNNRADNLEWVTQSENVSHAYKTGLKTNCKHTEDTKKKISESIKGKNHPMYGKTNELSPHAKKIICVTTGEIFGCIKTAAKLCKTQDYNIVRCCKGERKTAGKLLDGTSLRWMYYDDYLKQIEKEE